jgi:hypothetical protein
MSCLTKSSDGLWPICKASYHGQTVSHLTWPPIKGSGTNPTPPQLPNFCWFMFRFWSSGPIGTCRSTLDRSLRPDLGNQSLSPSLPMFVPFENIEQIRHIKKTDCTRIRGCNLDWSLWPNVANQSVTPTAVGSTHHLSRVQPLCCNDHTVFNECT